MEKSLNRWQVIIASTAILLCTGAIYAFSVFASPLSQQTGWEMSQTMLAFSINNAIGPIPMIFGGYLVDRGYVKWTISLGALLFALGFFLTGFATSPAMLYLTYGLMAGLGQGFAYSGALSNTLRLFPDKRGLASGILTGGMGFAAVLASPIASSLIQSHDAKFAFKALGLAYIVIVLIASFFIKAAPAGYKPQGWNPPAAKAGKESKTWTEMLKTPIFYIIISMFFIGAFSGLMIASQAATIGQSMFGLAAGTAALYVSLYSISNSSGRFIWGTISDKIGRSKALAFILGFVTVALFCMILIPGQIGFAIGIIGLGICFGGVMSVFPSMVMENYGPANQGVNYGIVFTGYSLAAYFAPKVAVQMATANKGDYTSAFYVAIVLALIGLALNFLYAKASKKS
ncbi:L-lactate MFS transporter [Streptococcus loxodontisalivarius]|uniref:OFA family oxalate/formate antiporter-like MFS transporter n=1 Tax=Streptococcus loxodontisalivarius TaxID=1349415 RepID=A0ABS2PRG8_9STRE|nr:OFA family MFS transporter [Streptococcus loxodontisalivarius]MBM7642632.1 OFA family oxalate/formate antiporter-like MFS transporter [Streptococcus loxodontisalivarius]